MGLNITGGIRAATGFMQGQDEATARNRAEEDRANLKEQRAYQSGQQARTVTEQGRADTLRSDLANIKDTTTTDLRDPSAPQVDDDGAPSAAALPAMKTTKLLPDQQLRQAAAAYAKAGDFANATKHQEQADKVGWDRSTKNFQELQASSASTAATALDVANQAAKIFSSDPFSGKVTNVRDDGNGGVTIDATNRETGEVRTKSFANKAELLESLHSYYSPATYQTLQAQRQQALMKRNDKIAEEQAKPITTPAGGITTPGVGDPRARVDNTNGLVWNGSYNPDGSPTMVKPGAGKDGKVDKSLPVNQAREILAAAAEKSNDKLEGDQRAKAETHLEQIYATVPNAPPAAAAEVARAVAKNPQLLRPVLNAQTGELDGVYRDKQIAGGKPFALAPNYMTAEEAEKAFPDDKTFMRKQVAELIEKQAVGLTKASVVNGKPVRVAITPEEAKAVQALYLKAAFDLAERKQLEEAARTAAGEPGVAALSRKLELIRKYTKAPGGEHPTGAPNRTSPFPKVGGIGSASQYQAPAGSPAARAQAVRDQARTAADAKTAQAGEAQAKLSKEFQSDVKTMPPLELARKYDALRRQLPTADAARLQIIERQIR